MILLYRKTCQKKKILHRKHSRAEGSQKKELDHILLDPTLYNNREKSVEINKQHKTIIQELNTLYNGWDTIHAELESVNDNQFDPV